MEDSEREKMYGEIILLRKMVEDLSSQVVELSKIHMRTIIAPTVQPVKMMMAQVQPEIAKLVDVEVDHGLMIFPADGVYNIYTAGQHYKGLAMLAHVIRWASSGDKTPQIFKIMQTLEHATKHVSL